MYVKCEAFIIDRKKKNIIRKKRICIIRDNSKSTCKISIKLKKRIIEISPPSKSSKV